jgi:hypothetical protein
MSAKEFRELVKPNIAKKRGSKTIFWSPKCPVDDLIEIDYNDGQVDEIRIVLPLTPSQNRWDRMHWALKKKFRKKCLELASTALMVQRIRFDRPPFDKASVRIIRCCNSSNLSDESNIIGGAKAAIDVLLKPKFGRPGIGLIVDDNPDHMTIEGAENRAPKEWKNLKGPGTWFIIRDANY